MYMGEVVARVIVGKKPCFSLVKRKNIPLITNKFFTCTPILG